MKSLIKRELLHIRWVTVLLLVALMIPLLGYLDNASLTPERYGTVVTLDSYDIIYFSGDFLLWFTLPLLVIIQFYYERKTGTYELLTAMPVSSRKRHASKFLAGLIALFVVHGAGLLLVMVSATSVGIVQGEINQIWYWFALTLGSSVMQYAFFFMVATLCGQGILAGATGFITLYAPVFIASTTLAIMDTFMPGIYFDDALWLQYLVPQYLARLSYDWQLVPLDFVFSQVNGYLILSLVFFLLSRVFWVQGKREYTGNLFMFRWAEHVFRYGFSLCFFLIFMSIAAISSDGWLFPVFLLIALGSLPVGWLISGKILEFTGCQICIKHPRQRLKEQLDQTT